jgi:redox-sensitive bicupin YhaK (pirin superfamily)
VRTGRLFLALAILGTCGCAGVAVAAGPQKLHQTSTFELAAGKTTKFTVPYPDALEYFGAVYAGSVTVNGPSASERGRKPDLRKVTIESQGNALGGSEYAAKVENANAPGTAPVRVVITAATTLPAGARKRAVLFSGA